MSKIISQFNDEVSERWTTTEAANGAFLSLAVSQNPYGAYIFGLQFGMNILPVADANAAGVWVWGFRGFVPSDDANIYATLGFGSAGLPVGISKRKFLGEFAYSNPMDRSPDYSTPIFIPGGEPFAIVLATLTRALTVATLLDVYMIVRGKLLTESDERLLR